MSEQETPIVEVTPVEATTEEAAFDPQAAAAAFAAAPIVDPPVEVVEIPKRRKRSTHDLIRDRRYIC